MQKWMQAVSFFSKGCNKTPKHIFKLFKKTIQNRDAEKYRKLDVNYKTNMVNLPQNPPKNLQNPSNIDAQNEAMNKHVFFEKSDVWDCCSFPRLGSKSRPKWHPKIMKKPTSKKYAKIMAKGSKQFGKLS